MRWKGLLVTGVLIAVVSATAILPRAATVGRARTPELERRAMVTDVANDGPAGLRIYLALGDSLAAGVGASAPAVTGYVPRFYQFLVDRLPCSAACSRLRVENMAVSGATSTTLLDDQLPAAVTMIRSGGVKVVTLDIGANDVLSEIEVCSRVAPVECLAAAETAVRTFEGNFNSIMAQLRAAGGPKLSITVLTYYNSVQTCDLSAYSSLADFLLNGGALLPKGLNTIIRTGAAAYGARVADLSTKLTPRDYPGGADCWHPSDAGYAKIAEQLIATWSAP